MHARKKTVERYSRQMLVPSITKEGQDILSQSRVLIIGAGGIGSTVLMYLAGAGIGSIDVVDFDLIEESNLHRQIIHRQAGVGTSKCHSAVESMRHLNPLGQFTPYNIRLDAGNALELVRQVDIVVDASDNFNARYVVNDACVLAGRPLVSGAAVGLEGHVSVLHGGENSPCYRCIYPTPSIAEGCRSCANAGVLGPVAGLVGCLQAIETIKVLLTYSTPRYDSAEATSHRLFPIPRPARLNTTAGSRLYPLTNRQSFYDGASGEWFTFSTGDRDTNCAVCGDTPIIRSMRDSEASLSAASTALCAVASPDTSLLARHRAFISTTDYFHDVVLANVPHYVLDVRSTIQFGIVSFQAYSELTDGTGDPIAVESDGNLVLKAMNRALALKTMRLISVPFDRLSNLLRDRPQGNEYNPTESFANLMAAFNEKNLLPAESSLNIAHQPPQTQAEELPAYVLCRRGIDSVRATSLLLETGFTNVFNIEGGLNSWCTDVDDSFPSY